MDLLSKMDKDDGANLDVEYKRYLQILKPYLGQLLDPEDIELCNAWIHRLSDCEEIEKNRRNKYLFTLCFQLANGVLTHPFTNHPPPNELPMLFDESNSDDSFSEAESQANFYDQNNIEGISDNATSLLQNIFQSARSNTSTSSKRNESILDNSKEIHVLKNQVENRPSTSNSTIANKLFYSELAKDLSYCVQSEDNVYIRVNNLIDKLREMKKQNTTLSKELEAMKEDYNKKDSSTETVKLVIHSSTNTETIIEDIEYNEKNPVSNCKSYMCEFAQETEKFNNLKLLEIEELKLKHEAEIVKLKSSLQQDVKDTYEKKIQAIRQEYDLNINNMKAKTETEINQLRISVNEINAEREKMLAMKNQEINNLKAELEEVKTQNFELRNSFNQARHNYNPERLNEKALEFEKKLYKIEKAKNKRVKAYQAQLASLHYSKNLLDSSFHLQLLKQRTELISDFTHENQKELITSLEKLESKYKEIVANVQAAAIQRRIQDQIALETIIRTVFDKGNHLLHSTEDSHNIVNSKTLGNVNNDSKNPFSSVQSCCKGKRLIGKVTTLEDSLSSGFCMDEIKLEELFERVHIPQKDTDTDQSLS